jgi:hypothetical protein
MLCAFVLGDRICATADLEVFKPSSGNIVCELDNGAAPLLCAGDPGPLTNETEAKVLAEGSTLVKGEIGCLASKSDLVCVNSKGRGFLLSRTSPRL